MDTLLSYYIGEIITRVIPGIIVIGLYGSKFVTVVNSSSHDSSTFLTICIILIAWLIGLTLDIFFFAVGGFFLKLKRLSWFHGKLLTEKDALRPDKHPNKESDAQKCNRLQLMLINPTRALFRVMLCISIITIFSPPTTDFGFQWSRYNIYSIGGALAFFVCWGWSIYARAKPANSACNCESLREN
jgi:hypothetical protein